MGEVYSQCLLRLTPEPTNYSVDRNAVAVIKEGQYRPCSLQPGYSPLLHRS